MTSMTEASGILWDDLKDAAPTIPEGEYTMRVVDAEERETREGGGRYINYRATVIEGPHSGKSVFGIWVLKPAQGKEDTTYFTKRDLRALGFRERVVNASTVIGLAGVAYVSEGPKRNADGSFDDEVRENRIKKWVAPF